MILADFLELRRGVSAMLLSRSRDALTQAAGIILAALQTLEDQENTELSGIVEPDLKMPRAMLEHEGQFAVISVLDTVEEPIRSVPLLPEAMYSDFDAVKKIMADILYVVLSDASRIAVMSRVEDELAATDQQTVAQFRTLMEDRVDNDEES